MEEPTDLEYVLQVRGGNRQAFTGLMRRHQERVYWIARRFVGNHADADDIVQETFVKAYLGLGDFRNDAAFFTWLYRITVNLSLNANRKKQVMAYLRESDLIARFLPGGEKPDDRLVGHETEKALYEAMTTLPEKQRSVFVLRFFERMPYEEISDVLKTSVGGLKANYHHAIRKIREQMSDVEPEQR
ncbi:MAG: sigma-70 family RNA polymerase sigma factor [Ignavibacteria bacterium]|nr:sigma-70 family RNA polymerase sigma factor [Ignavibacteria bacterium]